MLRKPHLLSALTVISATMAAPPVFAAAPTAPIRVCVDVVQKSWKDPGPAAPAPAPAKSAKAAPAVPVAPVAPVAPSALAASVAPAAPAAATGASAGAQPLPDRPAWFVDQNLAARPAPAPAPAPAEPALAPGTEDDDASAVRPELYLRRLIEYEVTHDEGYDAAVQGCQDRLTVELYELRDGWTVFGRFTRYAREEKVDHVRLDEFAALAERMAKALLHDKAIGETITRHNVLRNDSETRARAIRGSSHLQLGLGTSLRLGMLPTAVDDDANAAARDTLRPLTPLAFTAGYRGKFRTWGLEAFARVGVGTSERAARRNQGGGHADYEGSGALGLHFLKYADAAAMNSIYYGGGATFELQRFSLIRPATERTTEARTGLWTGGLDVDLLLGYEFMRASAVHFYAQVDVNLPAYVVDTENAAGRIKTYLPGAIAQIGVLF
jgi:hypothetical protein